jgi:large subunit ribosomal protein L15
VSTGNEHADERPAERIGLHNLKPAPGSRRPRKRIGRGEGSGTGKTSGRGQKGYGSRAGAKSRARFEGGQMPIHMRKLRGPHMKKSMPFEPFRTHTQAVNLKDLEARFEAGASVGPEDFKAAGIAKRPGIPIKVLAKGELSKPLTVTAHRFSGAARQAIEAVGGTCVEITVAASGSGASAAEGRSATRSSSRH